METVRHPQGPGLPPLQELSNPHEEGLGPTSPSLGTHPLPYASIFPEVEWKTKGQGSVCTLEKRCLCLQDVSRCHSPPGTLLSSARDLSLESSHSLQSLQYVLDPGSNSSPARQSEPHS